MKSKVEVCFPRRIPDTKMTGRYVYGRPEHLLQKNFRVLINDELLLIKAGLLFDFASVPRPFWPILLPSDPVYAAAALLHDLGYGAELWPRAYVDKLFLDAMRALNVSRWKRMLMYSAVRIGGRRAYSNHTVKHIREVRGKMGIVGMGRPLVKATQMPKQILLSAHESP